MTDNPIRKILDEAAAAIITYRLDLEKLAIAGEVGRIVEQACIDIDRLCPDRQRSCEMQRQALSYHQQLAITASVLESMAPKANHQVREQLLKQAADIIATLAKGGVF